MGVAPQLLGAPSLHSFVCTVKLLATFDPFYGDPEMYKLKSIYSHTCTYMNVAGCAVSVCNYQRVKCGEKSTTSKQNPHDINHESNMYVHETKCTFNSEIARVPEHRFSAES